MPVLLILVLLAGCSAAPIDAEGYADMYLRELDRALAIQQQHQEGPP